MRREKAKIHRSVFQLETASNIWEKLIPKNKLTSSVLFNIYEAKLSCQMVKSLSKSIIKMYLMGACAILGMSNSDAPSENLESDPFLISALQRLTCELHHRSGWFLAPLSIGMITGKHYLSEHGTKNGGSSGDNRSDNQTANNSKKVRRPRSL